MKRDVFQKIIDWNASRKREPLILMGARQVGKTWLMDEFAGEFYPDSHVKVDLQRDVFCGQGSTNRTSIPRR